MKAELLRLLDRYSVTLSMKDEWYQPVGRSPVVNYDAKVVIEDRNGTRRLTGASRSLSRDAALDEAWDSILKQVVALDSTDHASS